MKLDLKAMIKHKTYEILETYVAENHTGLAYIYIIMNQETKNLLCDDDTDRFYGVHTAISNDLKLGEVLIVK